METAQECQLDLRRPPSAATSAPTSCGLAPDGHVLVTALRRRPPAPSRRRHLRQHRLKLLKIGALVTRSVRRIRVAWPRAARTPPSSASPTPDYAADHTRPAQPAAPPTNPDLIAPRRSAQPRRIPPLARPHDPVRMTFTKAR